MNYIKCLFVIIHIRVLILFVALSKFIIIYWGWFWLTMVWTINLYFYCYVHHYFYILDCSGWISWEIWNLLFVYMWFLWRLSFIHYWPKSLGTANRYKQRAQECIEDVGVPLLLCSILLLENREAWKVATVAKQSVDCWLKEEEEGTKHNRDNWYMYTRGQGVYMYLFYLG